MVCQEAIAFQYLRLTFLLGMLSVYKSQIFLWCHTHTYICLYDIDHYIMQDCRKQKLSPTYSFVWPEHREKLPLPQCEGTDTIPSEKVKVDADFQSYLCMSAVVGNIWPGAWQT